jgi:hypothetical protein
VGGVWPIGPSPTTLQFPRHRYPQNLFSPLTLVNILEVFDLPLYQTKKERPRCFSHLGLFSGFTSQIYLENLQALHQHSGQSF